MRAIENLYCNLVDWAHHAPSDLVSFTIDEWGRLVVMVDSRAALFDRSGELVGCQAEERPATVS